MDNAPVTMDPSTSAPAPAWIARRRLPGGQGLSDVLRRRAAVARLDWDLRQRSRFEVVDDAGRRIAVFLPRGQVVRGGDVLVIEQDGSLVRIDAAPQPVMVVRAAASSVAGGFDLLRAAYHLGNRHVALELRPDRLLLEPDSVLAEMLARMGLQVEAAELPFEPEGGAYAGQPVGQGHAHGHGHGHGHDHDHDHDHDHGHDPGHTHAD